MTKEDTSAGLLSKMVKFVRNPATSWTGTENKEADRDEAVSKLLLKEMIERKRSNDFVRKREFDMLRKMRKRESLVGQDPEGRPSFFHSSMPSRPDDRAMTIKKIDEIEAQMSMQWWKTKQGTSSSQSSSGSPALHSDNTALPPPPARPAAPDLASLAPGLPVGYGVTEPIGLYPLASSQENVQAASGEMIPPEAQPPGQKMNTRQPHPAAAPARGYGAAMPGAVLSNLIAMDLQEVAHDAEVEEASISYANGDDASAETALLDMLAPGGVRTSQSEVWMALFDLYRGTDQQEKFETAAIRFVQKFDRSAPQWFSMPALVKQLARPAAPASAGSQTADWICSSTMGIQTVAALKAALSRAPMPWRLNWSNLKAIEANAVEPLCRVFQNWAVQPVKLQFMGEDQFQKILQNATPSDDNSVSQDWWQLRMEALRVTNRPDEFELVALDFCVTYEVSPPSWEVARCEYKSLDSHGASATNSTIIGDVYRDSSTSGLSTFDGDTLMEALSSQMSNLLTVELSGQIEGDAVAMLEQLEAKLLGADLMTISCTNLIRVDFSAAGTLLNWVSARQAENRAVHFCDVNRLVAAFFNVIGITEHARVTVRRD